MKVFGLGLKGEQAAKRYLRKKGYQILATNYQCRFGELDLVAKDKTCLVFCEVKTRSPGMIAPPQESVTYTKQQKMIKTAQFYIAEHRCGDMEMRFDVLAVTADERCRLSVEHLENVIVC